MLRNIIITIGFLVALDPYLGFPESIDALILTTLGLALVFLTALSRRGRVHRREVIEDDEDESPKILHVERTEVEDTPQVHIGRVTTVDKEITHEASGEDTEVEKKTTVVRKRKRKQREEQFDVTPSPLNEQDS